MAMKFSTCSLLLLAVATLAIATVVQAARPPAVFIFGDSTVDVGTNNFLQVSEDIKANFPYNGIDYPYAKATGRFSNGYNTADQIVRLLGYKKSPRPFLDLVNHPSSFKKCIVRGVNFASGGSGILDSTGLRYNNKISLGEQIRQFSTVQANITELSGPAATAIMLSKSVFLISSGSNDVFEYQQPINGTTMSPPQLLEALGVSYHNHLKNLYDLGARRFGIISIPPIGCCPAERVYNLTGGCVTVANNFAQQFYTGIVSLLNNLTSELPGMTYSLGNSYEMTMTVMDDPLAFGITNTEKACCGDAQNPCNRNATVCKTRHQYLFWDRFHPTQRTAELAALTLYGGSTRFVTPMNFSQLANV